MDISTTTSILGVIGTGSIVGAFFTYFWQKRKEIILKENELKEKRYLCITLLMYACINPNQLEQLTDKRPDIKTLDNLKNELQTEWVNAWIFAGDKTIKAFEVFLEEPNELNFAKTILSMRKELWNRKSKLNPSDFKIVNKK